MRSNVLLSNNPAHVLAAHGILKNTDDIKRSHVFSWHLL